jgi:glutamine cyclotransferase
MFFSAPNMFFGACIGASAGTLACLFVSFANISPEHFERQVETTEIISLQGNTSVSGSFFLGTGSFEGEKVYYYYIQTQRGAISRKVDADETYVKETSTATPTIKKVRYKDKGSLWHFTIPPDTLDEYNQVTIPEGSIKREYKPN